MARGHVGKGDALEARLIRERQCKGAKVSAAGPRGGKVTRGQVGKGQRPSSKGNRIPGCLLRALGRAWLSEPAVGMIVIRASVRERTARRAVPTRGNEGSTRCCPYLDTGG